MKTITRIFLLGFVLLSGCGGDDDNDSCERRTDRLGGGQICYADSDCNSCNCMMDGEQGRCSQG